MKTLKKPFLFALTCLPFAAIGGFFSLRYQLDLYPEETVAQMVAQIGSKELLFAVGLIETVIIVMLAAFFGRLLADKTGLWRSFRFCKKELQKTSLISLAAGILFSLDYWIFGTAEPQIQEADLAGQNFNGVLASVLYGGIVEELLLRLFFMSLVGFILWKLFWKKWDTAPAAALIAANILAALLFAAAHIPATVTAFGSLTPLLIFRCLLLNGGFGILFGWLYRKYGIQYAMVSHGLCHLVCKLIWLIAV